MSIRRRRKIANFTQISNSALLNPALSLKAKGLLSVMMTRPEDWSFYMSWLQRQSADGREAHQNAMKELEAHRYVVRLRVRRPDGTFQGWEYLVDDECILDVEPGTTVLRDGGIHEPTNGEPVYRSPDRPADEQEIRRSEEPSDGEPATTNTDVTKIKNQEVAVSRTDDARGALERDDEGVTEQESIPPEGPQVPGAQLADLPAAGLGAAAPFVPSPASDEANTGTSPKDGPKARECLHELSWDPVKVNEQLDQLISLRWTRPWTSQKQAGAQRPLIDEVDASGVDRHEIARQISLEHLREIVRGARRERARLEVEGQFGRATVPSFQHLLIQALQRQVLHLAHLREVVAAWGAGRPGQARSLDGGEMTPLPSSPLIPEGAERQRGWQVGDQVSYRRDRYTIVEITDRKITLESETCGSVDIIRASDEIKGLRLVAAARSVEADA